YKPPHFCPFMPKKSHLSLNAMDKILREAGAVRVSDKAKEALAEILQEKGVELGRDAARYALHAGRRTVIDKDVQLAVKGIE
ncbi:MAG: histone family protein, partial [Nanoarchaeota archaeon]